MLGCAHTAKGSYAAPRLAATQTHEAQNMRILPLLISIGCTGCGSIPTGTYSNQPLPGLFTSQAVDVERARLVSSFKAPDAYSADDTGVFVGVSISGGGSRAASFGAAVLQELDEIGFLKNLTAISGVSGGSIPAAYYSLNRHKPDWSWDEFRKRMATDLLGKFIWRYLLPTNLAKTALTNFDRSDLMADIFDDSLFHGATFADLNQSSGPKLLINATSVTAGGEKFIFSAESFFLLNSDISKFKISSAVMASGAFPGVFNNVTLAAFHSDMKEDYKHFQLAGSASHSARRMTPEHYEHLLDGGPSDNLGVSTLLHAARIFARQRVSENKEFKGCIIFAVDAAPEAKITSLQLREKADARTWYDFFVDTNVLSATDALLVRQRRDFLKSIDSSRAWRTPTIGLFELVLPPMNREWTAEDEVGANALKKAACRIWHLTFESLDDMWVSPQALTEYRLDLRRLVSRIETNYRLAGPPGCDAEMLQEALYETARILVWYVEDGTYLMGTCLVADEAGLYIDRCKRLSMTAKGAITPPPLTLRAPRSSRPPEVSEDNWLYEPVRCTR